MSKMILLLALIAPCAFGHTLTVYGGESNQSGSYNIAVRYDFVEIQYVSEGSQRHDIPNINRVINLDLVLPAKYAYIKAGISCSRYGFNGSGNDYHNNTGFSGENVGIGIQYPITSHVLFGGEDVYMRYQQVDIPNFEQYNYIDIFIGYNF